MSVLRKIDLTPYRNNVIVYNKTAVHISTTVLLFIFYPLIQGIFI